MTAAPVSCAYSIAAAKRPFGRADRARVRGVVQEDGGDIVARRSGEVGRPAGVPVERHVPGASRSKRGPGGVVRVIRVGEDDRRPALGEHERELADRSLRPRHDRDLGVRGRARRRRARSSDPQSPRAARAAPKRRVTVRGGLVRSRSERVDHVLRRPDLGIPAPEIDERRPVERSVLRRPERAAP